MKSNFERLSEIADKNSKIILGLMSGTSMDGMDIALCRISGTGINSKVELLEFMTHPHTEEYQKKVRTVFTDSKAELIKIAQLDQMVAEIIAHYIHGALSQWGISPDHIDMIASHGQTVFHAPSHIDSPGSLPRTLTVQLGDGDYIARRSGIITVSDFRQKHIAAGGKGAPLALYGDLLLFSDPAESRILLNIGGIANFTFLPPSNSTEAPLSSDTGPGNTLMDAFMKKHFNHPYDRDAQVGQSGRVDQKLLRNLMDDPFFAAPLPRTTGPELFNLDYLNKKLKRQQKNVPSKKDIMATLHAFTAQSIAESIGIYLNPKSSIYISGGGSHNPLLMMLLKEHLPNTTIKTTRELGINPDAKEAIIFALLANECLFGIPYHYPGLGWGYPKTGMGKISFP